VKPLFMAALQRKGLAADRDADGFTEVELTSTTNPLAAAAVLDGDEEGVLGGDEETVDLFPANAADAATYSPRAGSKSSGCVQEDTGNNLRTLRVQALRYWELKMFDPSVPRAAQLFRKENVAIVLCYVLVGFFQGVTSGVLNGVRSDRVSSMLLVLRLLLVLTAVANITSLSIAFAASVYPLELGATEAQQTTVSVLRSLPATLKIVYGFLSDTVRTEAAMRAFFLRLLYTTAVPAAAAAAASAAAAAAAAAASAASAAHAAPANSRTHSRTCLTHPPVCLCAPSSLGAALWVPA
jgi:hypothetical protein